MLPNGQKIYQHLPLQHHPKFTQIGNFGLKTYQLATLIPAIEFGSWVKQKLLGGTGEFGKKLLNA
jgi:hypothetical protein